LDQVNQGQQLVKNYQTLRAAAGTGSAPIFSADGTITGFQQASKAQEIAAYIQLGTKALQLAQAGVQAGEATRLKDDAQKLYNENKWGIADVCNQTLVMLQNNAKNCYDSLNWWLKDQGTPGKSAGQKRIANRSVVIRQNALLILVKEIEARGSSFTPGGKGAAPVGIAAILALVAGAAFLRF
jgi:hypothetical protein